MSSEVEKPFKIAIGSWSVWSLSDGHLDIDQRTFFDVDPLVIKEELELEKVSCVKEFVVKTRINMYLIKTEQELILVDTGCGSSRDNNVGFLPKQLEKLGFKGSDITHVVITHLHGDHMGGLLDEQGEMSFPNAMVFVSKRDVDFWTNPENESGFSGIILEFFAQSRQVLAPYQAADTLKLIESEGPILPGIEIINAFGHTPGHLALTVHMQGQSLLLWTDIVHNIDLQVKHPQWRVIVDMDKDQGIQCREELFIKAADEKLLVGGGHLPSPGFGYLARKGNAFVWQSL